MTESLPTVERFPDPERPDPAEEFQPVDAPDPEEPELIQQGNEADPADPGEADEVDVAEQVTVVDDEDDGYDTRDGDG